MTERQKPSHRFTIAIAVVGIVAGLAFLPGGPLRGSATVEEAAEEVRVLPVKVTSITRVTSYISTRSYAGRIAPRRTSQLGFERAGRVIEVLVAEGDEVTAGQPLARLDQRHLQTRRLQIDSTKAQAEALLAELEAGPRQQTIAASRKQMSDLVAQHELANRNHQRSQSLFKQGATTAAQLDATGLALRSAAARMDAAKDRLEELEVGSRPEKVTAQRAAVKQLVATVQDLELDVEDSTVNAPFAGRISRRMIDEGAFVAAGQSVVEIMETGSLEARIGLPIDAAKRFFDGGSVNIMVDGHGINARFSHAQPGVDLQTRTRMVVFSLATDDKEKDANETVVPGQVARVQIPNETATDGFWLPTTSLVRGARGLWAAYAVVSHQDDEIIEQRIVEVLHTDGNRTLVRGTLSDGDRIIVSGTQRVVPGQAVEAIETTDS